MNENLVWYASYGSNLSRQRFLCYIQGGQPRGVLRTCEGARDRTPPQDDRTVTIHHPLYFAWESRAWRGGLPFLGHERDHNHVTLARMYLISMGQLEDVLAQENALDTMRAPAGNDPDIPYLESKYGCLVQVGRVDDTPILAYTSNEDMDSQPLNPPGIDYLQAMAEGLHECYGMDTDAVLEYLLPKPGIAGRVDAATLRDWLAQP